MSLPYTKKIVCLANSRKPPLGRCVAGRELVATRWGNWVRPVSARPSRELTVEERAYANGQDPRVLDIVLVPLQRHEPYRHQTENHRIDAATCWLSPGRMTWRELQNGVEDPAGPLWLNGVSSYHGYNDCVPEDRLAEFSRSLYLVRPESVTLIVKTEGQGDGLPARRRVRARFDLCGHLYWLAVTDPWIESEYLGRKDGETDVKDAILCVSLGEIFHGHAYKLAATILTPKRARE